MDMVYHNFLQRLRNVSVEPDDEQAVAGGGGGALQGAQMGDKDKDAQDKELSPSMQVRQNLMFQ